VINYLELRYSRVVCYFLLLIAHVDCLYLWALWLFILNRTNSTHLRLFKCLSDLLPFYFL